MLVFRSHLCNTSLRALSNAFTRSLACIAYNMDSTCGITLLSFAASGLTTGGWVLRLPGLFGSSIGFALWRIVAKQFFAKAILLAHCASSVPSSHWTMLFNSDCIAHSLKQLYAHSLMSREPVPDKYDLPWVIASGVALVDGT